MDSLMMRILDFMGSQDPEWGVFEFAGAAGVPFDVVILAINDRPIPAAAAMKIDMFLNMMARTGIGSEATP